MKILAVVYIVLNDSVQVDCMCVNNNQRNLGPGQNPMCNLRPSRACMHAQLLQLCPTLCNPMDCSPPVASVHGFFRQEYWSRLLCPSPGNLPDPGTELTSLIVCCIGRQVLYHECHLGSRGPKLLQKLYLAGLLRESCHLHTRLGSYFVP